MAVGYHKLNTSGARSRVVQKCRLAKLEDDIKGMLDFNIGDVVNHKTLGRGIVINGGMMGGNITIKFSCSERTIRSDFVEMQGE